jgi:hypothetical protein
MTTPPLVDHPMPAGESGSPHAINRDGHARQCKARTRSGARCRSFAVEGMTVCRMHGGASPQARAAASRRRAESEATVLLEQIWDPSAAPVKDPVEGLQRLVGRLEHTVNVLGARVSTTELDGPTGLAWARATRELRLGLEGMQRLDLAERHIELEKDRAEMVTSAFLLALDSLQLVPADRSRVVAVFLERLTVAPVEPVTVAGELG